MKKMVVGNLKMNLVSTVEREKYFADFEKEKEPCGQNSNFVLCVPAIHLEAFASKQLAKIGTQNIFWEEKGSFTGEISAVMAKNFGAQYTLVGHSERRKYFGESNADANLKLIAALKNKLTPIYCIGETQEQKTDGVAAQIIAQQVQEGFANIDQEHAQQIIIAYEPVWAIGSGKTPTADQILEVKILLKKIFAQMFGIITAEKIKILYGGSVTASLVSQVCVEPGLDGVLVGRESLVPKEFFKIVNNIGNSGK